MSVNFEDEDYVRVYSRDTATTKKLGWEGRTVLWHLFRIVPKSGVLELGEGDDLVEVVASLCDLPEEVTKLGLERLASRGVTVRHAASLEIVRFVEAQNARRSDRLRAQDYRDRQKAEALVSSGKMADASRVVTGRHDSSLPASPPPALPCPALPPPAEERATDLGSGAGRDLQAAAAAALRDPTLAPAKYGNVESWPEVSAVCAAFAATWGRQDRPKHQGDPRARAILGRFAEGYTVAQLEAAIRGSKLASHIAENQAHQVLVTILRDAAQVDKFSALTAAPRPPPKRGEVPVSPNVDHDSRKALQASRRVREFLEGAK